MKLKLKFFKQLLLLGCFAFTLSVIFGAVRADQETTDASTGYQPSWDTHKALTRSVSAPEGAVNADIAVAPDGKTVMVAFDRERESETNIYDPYYRTSTNNGQSWGGMQSIHTSTDNSTDVSVVYDASNIPHAVWAEDTVELLYSRLSGSWTSPATINIPTPELIATPRIFASGANTLDVVWTQRNEFQNPNIYHARSTNGGVSWSSPTIPIYNSSPNSEWPALYVDGNTIYAVWAEQAFSPATARNVFFSVSENGGGSWSTHINISDIGGDIDGRAPEITIHRDKLQVVFTQQTDTSNQFIQQVYCDLDNDCTNKNNWVSNGSISGQVLTANNSEPAHLFSTIGYQGGCLLTYFHGGEAAANEKLYGTSNCVGNTWSSREEVVTNAEQSLHPVIEVHNNWFVYLAYQQDDGTGKEQIWFVRNKPAVYLPLIVK